MKVAGFPSQLGMVSDLSMVLAVDLSALSPSSFCDFTGCGRHSSATMQVLTGLLYVVQLVDMTLDVDDIVGLKQNQQLVQEV